MLSIHFHKLLKFIEIHTIHATPFLICYLYQNYILGVKFVSNITKFIITKNYLLDFATCFNP